jgi:hypothetical protein
MSIFSYFRKKKQARRSFKVKITLRPWGQKIKSELIMLSSTENYTDARQEVLNEVIKALDNATVDIKDMYLLRREREWIKKQKI